MKSNSLDNSLFSLVNSTQNCSLFLKVSISSSISFLSEAFSSCMFSNWMAKVRSFSLNNSKDYSHLTTLNLTSSNCFTPQNFYRCSCSLASERRRHSVLRSLKFLENYSWAQLVLAMYSFMQFYSYLYLARKWESMLNFLSPCRCRHSIRFKLLFQVSQSFLMASRFFSSRDFNSDISSSSPFMWRSAWNSFSLHRSFSSISSRKRWMTSMPSISCSSLQMEEYFRMSSGLREANDSVSSRPLGLQTCLCLACSSLSSCSCLLKEYSSQYLFSPFLEDNDWHFSDLSREDCSSSYCSLALS